MKARKLIARYSFPAFFYFPECFAFLQQGGRGREHISWEQEPAGKKEVAVCMMWI